MAIGKVDAYATVQAPNVDFGDIAVNAQKFQGDLLDKMRADKAAQLKAKEYKPVDLINLDPANIANGTINGNWNNLIKNSFVTINELNQIRTKRNLTNEEFTTFQNAMNGAKTLKERSPLINEGLKSLPDIIKNSSVVSKDVSDFGQNLATGQGIQSSWTVPHDDMNVYVWARDKDNNLIPEPGNDYGGYKISTYQDDNGKDKPLVITTNDIATGRFKSMFYQKNDINKITEEDAKTIGIFETSDEKGNVTVSQKIITPENQKTLLDNIKLRTESNKFVGDMLNQLDYDPKDPNKYARIPQGGYSQEQKDFVAEKLLDKTMSRFGLSYKKSLDEPTRITINNGGPKKLLPTISTKPLVQTITHYDKIPEGSKAGVKAPAAYKETMYMLPISRGQKIDVSGVDSNVEGIGKSLSKDGKTTRYFLKYTPTINQSISAEGGTEESPAKQTVGGKFKSKPEYLYLDKNADEFMNVASQFVNPETNEFFNNYSEVTSYLEKKLKGFKPSKQQFTKTNNVKVPGL